jgi:protein SCO1/2
MLIAAAAVALPLAACGGGGTDTARNDAAAAAPSVSASPSFDPESWHGAVLGQPLELPHLVLTDTDGQPFDLRAQTLGDPTLLFFGYTHCPDICPIHMATIARAMERTGVTTDDVDVVFVTNDPARDTPDVLGAFLERFDPGFIGLTGDLETIVAGMADLGLPPPEFIETDEEGVYWVGHPAQVIAFDADGRADIVYPFGVELPGWTADLPKLIAGERPHV